MIGMTSLGMLGWMAIVVLLGLSALLSLDIARRRFARDGSASRSVWGWTLLAVLYVVLAWAALAWSLVEWGIG